jgi:hypothetical protein
MTARPFIGCLLLLVAGACDVGAETPATAPWKDGETATYIVYMGVVEAAEGTFSAHSKNGGWEFKLKLASRGLVDEFYPFVGYFWSDVGTTPTWRSVEYGEFRLEPKRTIRERTQIDYVARHGTRQILTTGKSKTFPIAEDSVDDVGSLLYHLRTGTWKPGDHRVLHVYESDSEKEALASCDAVETRAFGPWPAQPLLRITVLPGKGTHHRGKLTLWMTDDARHLPLHAELEFRYGTFSIDLELVK